jgi:flagellar basal body-associated protein FliL
MFRYNIIIIIIISTTAAAVVILFFYILSVFTPRMTKGRKAEANGIIRGQNVW